MSMQPSATSSKRPSQPTSIGWAVAALALLSMFALSGCSAGGESDGVGASQNSALSAAGQAAAGRAAPAPSADSVSGGGTDSLAGGTPKEASYDSPTALDPALADEALIKTAAVALVSDDIATVIAKVDELATRTGGNIASEDTSTNTHGVEVSSRIELEVPVLDFDRSVDEISRLGDLVSKSRSSQDVTSRVVDVTSRVASAKDSIAQLRTLFNRATKLGDVIALERELSDREANLEALQSELRTLSARTTMSTITLNVTSSSTTSPPKHDQARGGFLSGIKQGWHELTTFVLALSHGLGLVLPLGSLALITALLGWLAVRRHLPRRTPRTSE